MKQWHNSRWKFNNQRKKKKRNFIRAKLRIVTWEADSRKPWELSHLLDVDSVQFSHSVVSDSLQPHGLQHTRPPCPSSTPRVYSKLISIESVMPSNHLILCRPLLPPSILSQHQDLFKWVSSWHQVAKVLEFQLQHQSFQWIFRTDFL